MIYSLFFLNFVLQKVNIRDCRIGLILQLVQLCWVHITLDSLVFPISLSSTKLLEVCGIKVVSELFAIVSVQWNGPSCRIAEAESQCAFKFVAVVANCTHISNINLLEVGCVKVVGTVSVPITVQSCGAFFLIGQNSEFNPLILVSMVASQTHIDDTNFCQVGCVEMVMATPPVAVYCKDV